MSSAKVPNGSPAIHLPAALGGPDPAGDEAGGGVGVWEGGGGATGGGVFLTGGEAGRACLTGSLSGIFFILLTRLFIMPMAVSRRLPAFLNFSRPWLKRLVSSA